MNLQHRLLFAFLIAFALGATAIVVLRAHQNEAVPAHADPSTSDASSESAVADASAKSADDPNQDDDDKPDAKSAWPEAAGSPEQVMYAQPQMMQDAIDKLAPRRDGKVNLFLVTFAGDGEENVFRNEADFVEQQFAQRFDTARHIVSLVNNPATLADKPVATLSNLETAIKAIARKMDPENDVLMLFLTSHGSRDHQLYVNMDPLPLDQIEPDDLADILADTPIRWKVIVISACYSGGFINALKDSDTLIITAARKDRTSFGCGTSSPITDFGRAFFVEGMNHHDSFIGAFDEAKTLVDQWETRDDEKHSFPQISSSPSIEAKLKQWRADITLGPAVPFEEAVPARPTPVSTPSSGSLTAAIAH